MDVEGEEVVSTGLLAWVVVEASICQTWLLGRQETLDALPDLMFQLLAVNLVGKKDIGLVAVVLGVAIGTDR